MATTSTPKSRKTTMVDAVLRLVAERGLDGASVREVATAVGVSIGTVQYHFPTKDEMLTTAYQEVVDRIRTRLQRAVDSADVRQNLTAVLSELLPIDRRRKTETHIHLAFAMRAATMPALADIQRAALTEIQAGVQQAFAVAWGQDPTSQKCVNAARAAIAVADGLALHAISTGTWLTRAQQVAAVTTAVDALLGLDRQP